MKTFKEYLTESYGIHNYKEQKADVIDLYDYILNYYEVDSNEIGMEDINIEKTKLKLSDLEEVPDLVKKYEKFPEDKKRVDKIRKNIDKKYPIFLHDEHIIAGTHRAVAFKLENIDNVIIYNVSLDDY